LTGLYHGCVDTVGNGIGTDFMTGVVSPAGSKGIELVPRAGVVGGSLAVTTSTGSCAPAALLGEVGGVETAAIDGTLTFEMVGGAPDRTVLRRAATAASLGSGGGDEKTDVVVICRAGS